MEFFAESINSFELRNLQDPSPGPEEIVEARLDGQRRARQLRTLLGHLPAAERTAIESVFGFDGNGPRTHGAAAASLGRSRSGVGAASRRGTQRLAERIDGDPHLAELMRA